MKIGSCALAAVLMGSFLGMAHATAAVGDVRHKEVYYGDLDLNSRDGAATLYRRIEAAARFVCEMPNQRTPAVQAKMRACTKQSTARAYTEANTPALAHSNGAPEVVAASRGLYVSAPGR